MMKGSMGETLISRLGLIVLLAVLGPVFGSQVAQAKELIVNVENSLGVPQSNTLVYHNGRSLYTDYEGRAIIRNPLNPYLPSDERRWVVISRGEHSPESTRTEAPNYKQLDGYSGVGFKYFGEGQKTVTLPALPHNPPGRVKTSRSMRLMVGLVNQLRVKEGVEPIQISSSLSKSAQNYAEFFCRFRTTGDWERNSSHFLNGDHSTRAADVGFSSYYAAFPTISENLAWSPGSSGSTFVRRAFHLWLGSPGHKYNMVRGYSPLRGLRKAIGVIGAGFAPGCLGTAVLMFSAHNSQIGFPAEITGLTGDYGDPDLTWGRAVPRPRPKKPRIRVIPKRNRLLVKRNGGQGILRIWAKGRKMRFLKSSRSKRTVALIPSKFLKRKKISIMIRFNSQSNRWRSVVIKQKFRSRRFR